MNLVEIKEQIKIGLTNGYHQNILLLSSFNNFFEQVREYLLTVNVAQQLLQWNENHHYKIQLEYPILLFYNNAFVPYDIRSKGIFDMKLIQRHPKHSPTKRLNQKIDIAIIQERTTANSFPDDRTLCGIELKAINNSQSDIINDAERMGNAMILSDKVSSNSIEFCFCGFLRRFDKGNVMVTEKFIQNATTKEQNRWNSICNDLSIEFPTLVFSVEHFDIINTPLEQIASIHKHMESDYSEVANDTGIVVGYILSISRK